MHIHVHNIDLAGTVDTDIHDVTPQLRRAIGDSGVTQGLATVFTPGSTAAVTCIEHEPGALADLRRALEEIAPAGRDYAHNQRWHDGNGYSHLRAALLGPGLSIPVLEGEPALGTWQQVVVIDFDNKPRRRRVVIQIMGGLD